MILEYPNVTGSGEIWLDVMRAICGDTSDKSMCDFMCHKAPYTPLLGFKERCYIDIQNRPLDHTEEQKYFILGDVLSFVYPKKGFDIAICSDGIEHFDFKDAFVLLKKMQASSEKQILFTPLGEWMVDKESDHPDSHRSWWTPKILEYILPNHWAYIIFPDFHPTMNTGAFFFWHSNNIKEDFEKVKSELNNKSWTR